MKLSKTSSSVFTISLVLVLMWCVSVDSRELAVKSARGFGADVDAGFGVGVGVGAEPGNSFTRVREGSVNVAVGDGHTKYGPCIDYYSPTFQEADAKCDAFFVSQGCEDGFLDYDYSTGASRCCCDKLSPTSD